MPTFIIFGGLIYPIVGLLLGRIALGSEFVQLAFPLISGFALIGPIAGIWLAGLAATALVTAAMALFAIGECLHGAVQGPLVADLAEPRLYGRYMALSALSWSVGFALGPAIGGVVLDAWPTGVWLGAATLCLLATALTFALEPVLPLRVRRTPVATRR